MFVFVFHMCVFVCEYAYVFVCVCAERYIHIHIYAKFCCDSVLQNVYCIRVDKYIPQLPMYMS